jgi:hypothetical protein
VAEYEAAQARLYEATLLCRHCKRAKTIDLRNHPEASTSEAVCSAHRERRRLNYVCSPVSETYWCS